MATTIVTKNSSTAAAVPTAAQLVQGELAVNVADKRIYTEDNGGAIVELGTNPSTLTVTGEITATGIDVTGSVSTDTLDVTGSTSIIARFRDSTNGIVDIKTTGITNSDPMQIDALNRSLELAINGSAKLTATSTGIDVTGTATMDGLVVDGGGSLTFSELTSKIIGPLNQDFIIQQRGNADTEALRIQNLDNNNLAKFNKNGDVSFYEDTGTTAKLFWDASAESLGIGTSSPTSYAAFGYGPSVEISGGNGGSLIISDTGQTNKTVLTHYSNSGEGILKTTTNKSLHFATNDSGPRMTIDTAGNVGIGTSSPASTLEIAKNDQTNGATLSITNSHEGSGWTAGDTVGSIDFRIDDSSAPEKVRGQIKVFDDTSVSTTYPAYSAMSFSTSLLGTFAERMRIDSSGNLLVGKTGTNTIATVGHDFGVSGYAMHSRDSSTVFYLNRNTSDGAIQEFYKDGTTVGSIGSYSGDLTVGTGDTGFGFDDANDTMQPVSATGGNARDGALSFGGPFSRFKDLYLSGGVYLGGTGAANKLDDYEEGTWTPVLGGGGTATNMTGKYTKVGNLVTAYLVMENSVISGTPDYIVSGLPFTSLERTPLSVTYYRTFNTACESLGGFVAGNGNTMQFVGMVQGGNWVPSDLTAGSTRYLFATAVYQTA